jgi:hypothetical protein
MMTEHEREELNDAVREWLGLVPNSVELGTCRYCEQRVPVMDLNERGVCEPCEMEGE